MSNDGSNGETTPAALADAIESGERVAILDVRNRDEVDAWRIEGESVVHTHVPHVKFVSAQVTGDADELVDPDESYVVVCPRGEASDEVARTLRDAGVDAVNLAGGMKAWARLYREQLVSVDANGLDVLQFRRPASGCLAYVLLADDESIANGRSALVVDPLRAFTDRYASAVADRDGTIERVLDTHVHADHVSGLRELASAADAAPLLSETAADRGVTYDVETLSDGDEIPVGDATIDVLATPGHTTGSISLRCGDLLLSGDSLFVDGVPRPDLEAGAEGADDHARELYATLTDRLAEIPDDVTVAPGHYVPGTRPAADGTYTATMGTLRERLRVFDETSDEFVDRILGSMGSRPANFERIIETNLGNAELADEDAFELELGPNNCAVAE